MAGGFEVNPEPLNPEPVNGYPLRFINTQVERFSVHGSRLMTSKQRPPKGSGHYYGQRRLTQWVIVTIPRLEEKND
jgi:hypothetical protein